MKAEKTEDKFSKDKDLKAETGVGKDMASKVVMKTLINAFVNKSLEPDASPRPLAGLLSRSSSKLIREEKKTDTAKTTAPIKAQKSKEKAPKKETKRSKSVVVGKSSAKARPASKSAPKVIRKRDDKALKKQAKKIAKVEKTALKRSASKMSEKKGSKKS